MTHFARPLGDIEPALTPLDGTRSTISKGAQPAPHSYDLETFLCLDLPPPELLLSPWLPKRGAAMIYGPRGLGKTQVALNVAYAVASGGSFLGWQATAPRRVAYLDGEMPAVELQRRLAEIEASTTHKVQDSTYLRIISDSLSSAGLPDLSDPASQRLYDDIIRNADLIVVDNLSTLCRGLKENDADTWTPMQSWALAQRRAGRTVLFVHHAGKGGNQRGTSRREDILDTVVALRRPPAWSAATGAHFQVHFEKSRGFYGEDAEPFEASLVGGSWRYSSIEAGVDDDTLEQLVSEGASVREIAQRTGLSKSNVQRRLKAREQS